MARVRRPDHTSVRLVETPLIDAAALFRGEVRPSYRQGAMVGGPLLDDVEEVSESEARVLIRASSSAWTDVEVLETELGLEDGVVDGLVRRGLLLRDDDGADSRRARDRAERYAETFWHAACSAYHMATRWRDIDVGGVEAQAERIREYSEPAPDPFYDHPHPVRRERLPPVEERRPLHELLRARRTTRTFDRSRSLGRGDLSAVLFHTFGCQGVAHSLYAAIKKNSPSGGALHPIEVYPLVRDVEGVAPGLYHYNVRSHALDLLRETDREEARRLSVLFTAGQEYLTSAHVILVLAARVYRHTWKYRGLPGSYRVMLLDAAHLSQTLFLVCTERGMGAFFTAAVNHVNIEGELGLDPIDHAVIGLNGCGIPADHDPLALPAAPYQAGS